MAAITDPSRHLFATRTAVGLLLLYALSVFVQVMVWQNNQAQVEASLSGLTKSYLSDAALLADGQFEQFLFGENPPSNANVLGHPPGYSILLTALIGIFGDNVRIAQILIAAFVSIIVWLIGRELFTTAAAGVAAVLTAISPQISYNSLILIPDGIAVLPTLAAVYFFILAKKHEQIHFGVACGLSIAASCWLRSNTLVLPFFVVLLSFFVLNKTLRARFILVMLATFVLAIAPITIRNYIGFDAFVPLSLGAGVNLFEGIADYDTEGRFGFSSTDQGLMDMEAVQARRPEFALSFYDPNGVERDRQRTRASIGVIKDNPLWFAGVTARRALSMFRLERVPPIADESSSSTSIFLYYANKPLRLLQRLFITAVILPLFLIGIGLLIKKREWAKLAILLTVPLYYACFQSPLHTEYRYVLAIQACMLLVDGYLLTVIASKLRKSRFE